MSQFSRPSLKFAHHWRAATDDNDLTLYGFRRFKTTHLLNLRFLEDEIAEIDHTLYQVGLGLGIDHSLVNRLGLEDCRKDADPLKLETTITRKLVLKLRGLVAQYDAALCAFNQIMSMQTFSLLDNEVLCSTRSDLTLPEMYKTRLLRVDLESRSRLDLFQDWIHKAVRNLRYRRILKRPTADGEDGRHFGKSGKHQWSYQDSSQLANILGRFVLSFMMGTFLTAPLAILSPAAERSQLIVIAISIIAFSFLIATFIRISTFEMVTITAAYTAVISAVINVK